MVNPEKYFHVLHTAVVSQFPSDLLIPCAPCYPAVAWQNKAFWYLKNETDGFYKPSESETPPSPIHSKEEKATERWSSERHMG